MGRGLLTFEILFLDGVLFFINDIVDIVDIVESAKELAIIRGLTEDPSTRTWAISQEDLRKSLHSELRNKESLPTTEPTIREWLMQRGDKREVDSVRSLRATRKSDARRNSAIDERVV